MKISQVIAVTILAVVVQGCSIIVSLLPQPDRYVINRWNFAGQLAVAHNMSPLDSIRQTADNTLFLHSGGTVAIASEKLTNFAGDFSITLRRGAGVRLATRTVEEFYSTEKGIAFVYTTDGSYIEENGRVIARLDSVRAVRGLQSRVFIINEGKKYRVHIGCNIVYRGETSLPATEYVIAQSLPESDVELAGLDFIPVRMGKPVDWNREAPWGNESGVKEVIEARPKTRYR